MDEIKVEVPISDYDRIMAGYNRVAELEGALDDALVEIADLRRWRERAWGVLRELGRAVRELDREAGFRNSLVVPP
jgi:hypothetical protein